MPWWCDKHNQHSTDDVCWQCDQDHDQPYIDAFLAGWEARHILYSNESSDEKKQEQLRKWKENNKDLLHTRLRGTHDT